MRILENKKDLGARRKSEVLENYNTRGRYGRKCAFWKTTGTRMIVFENGEKLRGSARKRIGFENAEKLRSARRVIVKNRRFAKLWNIAELDRIDSKKARF